MSGAKILLFCRLSLFTKYHKMFKIAVSFSGGGSGNKKRVCHKSHPQLFIFSVYTFLPNQSPFSPATGMGLPFLPNCPLSAYQ